MQIKLGDVGTIDRLGLAFEYQMKKNKKMDKNNCKFKILYKCIKEPTFRKKQVYFMEKNRSGEWAKSRKG